MIAVIKTGGKQYLVSPGKKIKIEKLGLEKGAKVNFEEILLFEDEKGNLSIGKPFLKNVKVVGEVIDEGLGEKKRVFKYKPKKRYKVKRGHRQPFTEVEIKEITGKKEETTKKKED